MIETGLDRRGLIPYPAEPRPEDLPLDTEYAVKPSYANANWRMIAEAIGKTLFTGEHYLIQDGGHYGASDTTHCRLTLPPDYTELNDWLIIGETQVDGDSRVWAVEISVEDAIEFTDSDLVKGAASTNNYNSIMTDLWFMTLSKKKIPIMITKDEICLGAFDKGLHGDDIRMSKTDATTVATKAGLIDTEHEADGSHSNEIIGNAQLKKDDVLKTQGFINQIRNGDFSINEAASRDYWDDVLTPVVTASASACGVFPAFFLDIDTNALNEGVEQLLKGFETNQPVTCEFWALGDVGGEKIKATLDSPSATQTEEFVLTTDWTKYSVELTPDSQCSFYLKILANQGAAQTFYIARVSVHLGDIVIIPERASKDVLFDGVHKLGLFVSDLTVASQFAAWVSERAFKILRVDIYCRTVPDANTTFRISDGITNYDITVNSGVNAGNNTADQMYPASSNMTMAIQAAATLSGADAVIVIQYRDY